MFSAMMDGIKEESVGSLFNLQVQVQENPIVEETATGNGLSITLEDPEAASPGAPAQATTGLTPGGPAPGGSAPGGSAPGGSAAGGAPARGSAAARGTHARGSARSETPRSGGPRQQGSQPQGSQPAQAGQQDGLPAGLGPRRPQRLSYSAPSEDGSARVETSRGPAGGDKFARAGRNDPCPCGSGRKFKRCHGDPAMRPDS
jgi:preprotein translocase subunit SecA